MKKLFVFILFFLFSLTFQATTESNDEIFTLESVTLSANFDKDNTNERWIQAKISPKSFVTSIQFISYDGSSTMLYPATWETSSENIFIGQPSIQVNLGNTVSMKINLQNGGVANINNVVYNKGSTYSTQVDSGTTGTVGNF
jgi:hypothetical protein